MDNRHTIEHNEKYSEIIIGASDDPETKRETSRRIAQVVINIGEKRFEEFLDYILEEVREPQKPYTTSYILYKLLGYMREFD